MGQVRTAHQQDPSQRINLTTLRNWVGVLNEERVEIQYRHGVEDDPVSPNLNISVACVTTCWARLRLYEALDDLLQDFVVSLL